MHSQQTRDQVGNIPLTNAVVAGVQTFDDKWEFSMARLEWFSFLWQQHRTTSNQISQKWFAALKGKRNTQKKNEDSKVSVRINQVVSVSGTKLTPSEEKRKKTKPTQSAVTAQRTAQREILAPSKEGA